MPSGENEVELISVIVQLERTTTMKQSVAAVALSITLLLLIGSRQASAEDDQNCSKASLRGSYGFQFSGSIPNVLAIGGIARVVFDGQGNFTQTDDEQISVSGQAPMVILDRPGTGTYTVNPDCTGSETLNAGGQVHHSRLVLVNHGKKIFDMGSDKGVVLTGVGEKQ
jgi:hypothetical protein